MQVPFKQKYITRLENKPTPPSGGEGGITSEQYTAAT
jgi:hypothetical protein